MALRIEKEGIQACVKQINSAIEQLQAAAQNINNTMINELPKYWEGDSYKTADETYRTDYQAFLTKTVPDNVNALKDYIAKSTDELILKDSILSGKG